MELPAFFFIFAHEVDKQRQMSKNLYIISGCNSADTNIYEETIFNQIKRYVE